MQFWLGNWACSSGIQMAGKFKFGTLLRIWCTLVLSTALSNEVMPVSIPIWKVGKVQHHLTQKLPEAQSFSSSFLRVAWGIVWPLSPLKRPKAAHDRNTQSCPKLACHCTATNFGNTLLITNVYQTFTSGNEVGPLTMMLYAFISQNFLKFTIFLEPAFSKLLHSR